MTRLPLLLAVAAAAVLPAAAHADGLPVLGVDAGPTGVASPTEPVRFVTLDTGVNTLVARVDRDGGSVVGMRLLRGHFTIPAVAYDGSAAGISGDGRRLVLLEPRLGFPRARTRFLILDAASLRVRRSVTLKGDFSFDAISPDGRSIYLVQYLSAVDPTKYLVRLYDVRARRLAPDPIIDPAEVGEVMRGTPVTRAASVDGRFVYTLYDGAGTHPFVHVLDTQTRHARCVDFHALAGYARNGRVNDLRLLLDEDAGTLTVVDGTRSLAVVDTRTYAVHGPRVAPSRPAASASEGSTRSVPWSSIAVPGAALLGAALALALARLRRRAAPA
jgi:hypothetical protein